MSQVNEEMYHFIISELEFQSKNAKTYAVMYGILGGLITFATCIVILAAFTIKPASSEPEPRSAVISPSAIAEEPRELRF